MRNDSAVSVRKEDVMDILDAANLLEGEEAVEQMMRFFDMPKDIMAGDLALKAVVRFYSNVRYLKELLQRSLVDDQ